MENLRDKSRVHVPPWIALYRQTILPLISFASVLFPFGAKSFATLEGCGGCGGCVCYLFSERFVHGMLAGPV